MIVDAHQHFWDPARGDYGWLKPDNPIHRIFGTNDLRPLLIQTGVDATILVQAAPTAAESDYMLGIARKARAGAVGETITGDEHAGGDGGEHRAQMLAVDAAR